AEALEKGQSFTGTVYEYKKGLGAFVAIEDRYSGLIHEDELYSRVLVGDVVSGRVTNVRPDGKADLSLRAPAYKQMNEDSEMVYAIIRSYKDGLPFNDKADKEIIKKEFGLSKNAFKRAVGHLLKEGKIEITDHSILIK
ncbi:MAG: S1 RNA-binding domain-containing protein, partial [Lachnospiraceae bacterium]|nr:S1 RNA-binding domain-containing protein [Lachnospiraceae bacterium]